MDDASDYPTNLSVLYRRLLALYELRLDAHYRAQPIPPQQARQGLDTVVWGVPVAITGRRAHRAGVQERGLHTLLEGRQRLMRIRSAHKGGTA